MAVQKKVTLNLSGGVSTVHINSMGDDMVALAVTENGTDETDSLTTEIYIGSDDMTHLIDALIYMYLEGDA